MESLLFIIAVAIGALAVGILVGRYYVPDDRALKRAAKHGERYMAAVNHLLARDRDAAADELLEVVDDNVDTLEPYFALASLFRSRGEWERAIRVHQAIELRSPGDKDVKLRCLYELGMDFRAAGMPRRATKALEECIAEDSRHLPAMRALCGLYEEQTRYVEAAKVWERLRKAGDPESSREAHLWAAAVQKALSQNEVGLAQDYLRAAERVAPENPHVLVAGAEYAAARDHYTTAAEKLTEAARQRPGITGYALPALVSAHAKSETKRGQEPDSLDAEVGARRAAEALSKHIADADDPLFLELAVAELESRFDAEKSLERLDHLASNDPYAVPARVASGRIALASGDSEQIAGELNKLVGAKGALAFVSEGAWRCDHCQTRFSEFFWRCSECRHWGTAHADTGEPVKVVGRRDRRERPRTQEGALLKNALPAAGIDYDDSDETAKRSVVGRARGWLSDAWGSIRRRD